MKFPHYLQLDAMDCGPTCLRMIAKFYGKNYSLRNCSHVILTPFVLKPNDSAASLIPSMDTPARVIWHLVRNNRNE